MLGNNIEVTAFTEIVEEYSAAIADTLKNDIDQFKANGNQLAP